MAESSLLANSAIRLGNPEDTQFSRFPKYTHLPFAERGDSFLCTYFRPILSKSSDDHLSPDTSGNSTDSETDIDHASNVVRWLESLPPERKPDDPEANGISLARKRKLTKNKNLLRVVENIVQGMDGDDVSSCLENAGKNSKNLPPRKSNGFDEESSLDLKLHKPTFRNSQLEKCLDDSMRKAVRKYKCGGCVWEDLMKKNSVASQEPPEKRQKSRLTPTPSMSSESSTNDKQKCTPWLCIQNYFTS